MAQIIARQAIQPLETNFCQSARQHAKYKFIPVEIATLQNKSITLINLSKISCI